MLPAASGEQAEGECASSSLPRCLFPRKRLFADACAAALHKTLPEAKAGCALSGQLPPDCPKPGMVAQKAVDRHITLLALPNKGVREGAKRCSWAAERP